MKRKTRKRLAKEAALAKAEARGDFSHLKDKKGNLKAEPLGQPTLPNVDFDDVDDDKHSQFHAYPPGRGGPAYPPPPPMSDYGGSDFYRPRPQHGYTPSLASNDARSWGGGMAAPLAGQSAVSLVPHHASKGSSSDVGVDYPPALPPGASSYGPPSYHSAPVSRSQTYASRPPPSPSPEDARNAAVYAALNLPNSETPPPLPPPPEGTRRISHTPASQGGSDYFSYGQLTAPPPHHQQQAYGRASGYGDIADFYDSYEEMAAPPPPQQQQQQHQQQQQPSSQASAYEPPSRAKLLERTLLRDDDRAFSVADSIGAESDFGDIYARADPGHHPGGGGPMDRRWQR
jgi:hypothetical protein